MRGTISKMEFENGYVEAVRAEQRAKIILTEQLVVSRIWQGVPKESRIAYETLEVMFENGYDVTSASFWRKERDTILRSGAGLKAKIRQTYIEDVFADVLAKFEAQDTKESALLFSRTNGSTGVSNEGETILDIYRLEQDLLVAAVANSEEQARQDVIQTVVKPDEFAAIGLTSPEIFVGGVLVTDINNDSRQIVVPTIMDGVGMRFRHPLGTKTPIVEFILNRVA